MLDGAGRKVQYRRLLANLVRQDDLAHSDKDVTALGGNLLHQGSI
jgi:hypothetical protein